MARRRTPRKKGFRQGLYTPRHPEKYIGDVHNIVYRSSWELEANMFFDNNENVLEWMSEEIKIPYIKPTTKKIHIYYPDYYVKYMASTGDVVTEIIEVKPENQTRRSRSRNKKQKLYEDITFAINTAKWQYATKWCEERGIKFRIMTERTMFK